MFASRKQVQSLAGLINFAAGCIKPGRIYFSRILNFLREMEGNKVRIPEEVFQWWRFCADNHNGVSLMANLAWETPDCTFSSDASLQGCGAWTQGRCFSFQFTSELNQVFMNINHKECVTILAAIRVWGKDWG